MKSIVVASFKEEAKAIEALHKLNELESFGDISIYEKIMVRKSAKGEFEILKEDTVEGLRTLTGLGLGNLLGMFGGPVGFVVGLFTGTAIGAIADMSHYDFAEDFIAKVKNKLPAGTVSIIAEIEEDSNAFIDAYLKPLGATIIRSDADFEYDRYVSEQIDEMDEKIADARADLKKSVQEDKETIQNKIAALKEKRRAIIAEFEENRKEAEKNIKDKAAAGIAKVNSEAKDLGNNISKELKEERAARIKRRIARYEEQLSRLKEELKEVQV